MPPLVPPPGLAAASHPLLGGLLWASAALYAAALAAAAARPRWGRPVLAAGVIVHLAATVGRGVAIGFFPLTSKVESFSAAALAVGIVALATWNGSRLYVLPLVALAVAALAAALRLPLDGQRGVHAL